MPQPTEMAATTAAADMPPVQRPMRTDMALKCSGIVCALVIVSGNAVPHSMGIVVENLSPHGAHRPTLQETHVPLSSGYLGGAPIAP